jgi:hypothetical protein
MSGKPFIRTMALLILDAEDVVLEVVNRKLKL